MQFEVAAHRLAHEFGAEVELSPTPYRAVRRTDAATATELRASPGTRILARRDGTLLALFESEYWLARLESDHPDWCLERSVV
jgi:peptide chain release factor 3